MKKWIIYLCVWAAVVASASAEEPVYRTFTSTDGQTIQARILRYEAGRDRVQLERKDGEKGWASLSVLSDSDQEYIREWVTADRMLTGKSLEVSFVKKTTGSLGRSGSTGSTDKEILWFLIRVKNTGREDIQKLKLKYRIYIEIDNSGKNDGSRIVEGSFEIDSLAAGQSTNVETAEVTLKEVYQSVSDKGEEYYDSTTDTWRSSSVSLGNKKVSEENLDGIWVKVYGPEIEGVPVVRDVYYPSSLQKKDYEWKPLEDD